MPEKVEDSLISGQIFETNSSDASISKDLEEIQSQINATDGTPIEWPAIDVYPPLPPTGMDNRESGEGSESGESKVGKIDKLSHNDSAFARFELIRREKRKAA